MRLEDRRTGRAIARVISEDAALRARLETVIRQWEAATRVHPIPILALTAHAAGDGAGRSLAAGCTEHLTKPIKKATLLEAIARNVSGKTRITPPEGY